MSHRILVCGDEPLLLETRILMLAHAGYDVVSGPLNGIESIPPSPPVELVVVGHSWSKPK
jgi:hypothetical protein